MGGSLGAAHADSIVRVMRLAGEAGAPVVGFVESGGARLQEGHAALAGYGRIFRASVELSGRVPQISVVTGVSAGGGAYSPALTDFVVMTESARMFLTGPKIVQAALGEEVSMEELGGPASTRATASASSSLADDATAPAWRASCSACSRTRSASAPRSRSRMPAGRRPRGARCRPRRDASTTCATSLAALVDGGDAARALRRAGRATWSPRWRGSTAGPVGVVANQPRRLGGVIDAAAAEKAALFVDACDRFGLPLVVLVDTPGFMPGGRQERAGVIRHGASLLRAFAGASVPKLTVVLRKAYGGAVITMNSKDLGADMVFAWPEAEIGIMAARQAVGIVHRRALAEQRRRRDCSTSSPTAYADEHLTAAAAAAERVRRRGDRARGDARRASPGRWPRWRGDDRGDPYAEIAQVLARRTRGEPAIRSYVALGDSFTAGTGCAPGRALGRPARRRAARRAAPASSTATSRSRARPAPRCSTSSPRR